MVKTNKKYENRPTGYCKTQLITAEILFYCVDICEAFPERRSLEGGLMPGYFEEKKLNSLKKSINIDLYSGVVGRERMETAFPQEKF